MRYMTRSLDVKLKHGEEVKGFPGLRVYHLRKGPEAEREYEEFERKYAEEVAELREERERQEREFDKKNWWMWVFPWIRNYQVS